MLAGMLGGDRKSDMKRMLVSFGGKTKKVSATNYTEFRGRIATFFGVPYDAFKITYEQFGKPLEVELHCP